MPSEPIKELDKTSIRCPECRGNNVTPFEDSNDFKLCTDCKYVWSPDTERKVKDIADRSRGIFNKNETVTKIVDKLLEDTDYSDLKIKADKYYVVRRDGKNLKLVTDTEYDYLQDATAAMFVWNNEHHPVTCWVKSGLEMRQEWPQSFIYETAVQESSESEAAVKWDNWSPEQRKELVVKLAKLDAYGGKFIDEHQIVTHNFENLYPYIQQKIIKAMSIDESVIEVKVKTPDGEGIKVGEGRWQNGSDYVIVQMPKSLGFNKPVRYKKEDVTIIESVQDFAKDNLVTTPDGMGTVKSIKIDTGQVLVRLASGGSLYYYHSDISKIEKPTLKKYEDASFVTEMATAQGTWDSISKSGRQLFCMNNNLPEQLAYKNWIELSKELQNKISSLMILRKDLQPRVVNTK